jgi:transcriptional regulator with XRE-family HTH domain
MAMEEERQREVGARIKELRGPRPQPLVADKVGVTLRAYQAWEAGGGIAWENLQRLAEFFAVSENFLLYGAETPEGPQTQLDRIERQLAEVLRRLPEESVIEGLGEGRADAEPGDAQDERAG